MSDAPGAVLRGAVDLSSLRNRPSPEQTAAAQGAAELVSTVTEAEFQQILDLSRSVPVVVNLWSARSEASQQLTATLEAVVRALAGRVVLGNVDADANPGIVRAFGAQSVPFVVAVIAGQPLPMFNGAADDQQVREVFAQLLQVAAQNGVTGTIEAGVGDGADVEAAAPAEKPLPPLHAEAYDAIEAGDYARAAIAYEAALAENPRDEDARAGLGQVKLLQRVQDADLQAVRAAAAAAPTDIDAQLAVADLDLAGGHVEDAFDRLLELFGALPADERTPVRERLLELFGLVGDADPRVTRARGRLSSLLF
ncbi:co-chaperone YbbN [Microbacterium sp. ZW T5_56]|uniref:co-chaperone YbbN n=1 Tax=Microbacterium sp. ZW T5_56 TaxID=3378081 RepID=UPI0038540A3B